MRKLLSFLVIIVIFQPLWAEIPMKQAVEEAIKMNAACKNHKLEAQALELAKQNAEKNKLFTADFGASYLFKSQQMEIVFPDTNPAPGVVVPGFSKKAGAKHNFDLKLGVAQPLYTGNILSNSVKLEEVKLALEKNKALLSKIDIASEVKASYFNYRMLKSRLASLDALVKQLEIYHERLQRYFDEELVRKSDLLETEAKIQEQVINRRDLEHAIEKEKINFKKLCGYNVEEIEKGYLEKVKELAGAFADFKANHPVLKTMDRRIEMLSYRQKMVKGKYLPQVAAFAELHYGKPGIDFFKNEWSVYFQGGLNVGFKVFDWNKKKRDMRIVDYEVDKIKNQQLDFTRDGEKLLKQLYDARESACKKLQTVEKLVQIATEDAGLKEKLVEEQQIANVDYLSALSTKERYESMRNTIEAQLDVIKVNINKLTGIPPAAGKAAGAGESL